MKLLELELANFRCFRSVRLQFPDGVTGIVGANGAGKSSLLEAIAWVLFGNVAARTTKDEIRRRGSDPAEPVAVTLRFQHEGEAFEVTRELRGRNATAEASVLRNGQVQVSSGASSASAATDYLAKVLGLDHRAFHASVMARQKELAFLSDQTPAERKALVMRLLGIDRVEEAIKSAREDKRTLRGRLDGLRSALEDAKALSEARDAAQATLVECRRGLEATAREIKELETRAQGLRWTVEEAGRTQERRKALQGELKALREALARDREALEGQRTELAEVQALEPRVAALKAEMPRKAELEAEKRRLEALVRRRAHREHLERERRELDTRRDALATERERLAASVAERGALASERASRNERRQALSEAVAKARERVHRAEAEARHLASMAEEKRRHADDIRKMGPDSPCPTCLRSLEAHHETLLGTLERDARDLGERSAKLARQAAGGTVEAATLARELDSLERILRELERRLVGLAKDEARIGEIEREAATLDERREGLERQLADLGAIGDVEGKLAAVERELPLLEAKAREFAVLESRTARLPQLERAANLLEARAQAAVNEENGKRKDLEVLPDVAERLETAQRELHAAEKALGATRERRAALTERQAAAARDLDRLGKRIEAAKQRHDEARRLESDLLVMESLVADRSGGLLVSFKEHLVGRLGPDLSREASHLFATLVEGLYDGLEIDGDYSVRVLDRGETFDVARYSGGEQDLAHLSLRLAISEVAAERAGARPGFLVLDEIFGSQDAERRASILSAIKSLTAHFPQIFLVTHIEAVREQADHVIRVERTNGESHAALV